MLVDCSPRAKNRRELSILRTPVGAMTVPITPTATDELETLRSRLAAPIDQITQVTHLPRLLKRPASREVRNANSQRATMIDNRDYPAAADAHQARPELRESCNPTGRLHLPRTLGPVRTLAAHLVTWPQGLAGNAKKPIKPLHWS
jgi:hypothetical protein